MKQHILTKFLRCVFMPVDCPDTPRSVEVRYVNSIIRGYQIKQRQMSYSYKHMKMLVSLEDQAKDRTKGTFNHSMGETSVLCFVLR